MAKIKQIPIRNKRQGEKDLFLVAKPYDRCKHYNGPFEVDEEGGKCICKACGEEVTAIFVLKRLMRDESRWMESHAKYHDQMKRLSERSRTKCDHCGKMTRISRK